jgi:hypothetical protein
MTDDPESNHFLALCSRHFDPLCQTLMLTPHAPEIGRGFARTSANSGNVRIYFEHDRGLCSFAIGALAEMQPLCTIEELSQRFPRVRLTSEGFQRLSLEEQSSFIQRRWQDLQVMFSPEHLPETRRWNAARAAAITKKYSGEN